MTRISFNTTSSTVGFDPGSSKVTDCPPFTPCGCAENTIRPSYQVQVTGSLQTNCINVPFDQCGAVFGTWVLNMDAENCVSNTLSFDPRSCATSLGGLGGLFQRIRLKFFPNGPDSVLVRFELQLDWNFNSELHFYQAVTSNDCSAFSGLYLPYAGISGGFQHNLCENFNNLSPFVTAI